MLCSNTITHLHHDLNGCSAMCSLRMTDCPIHQSMIHTITSHNHLTTLPMQKACICPKAMPTITIIDYQNQFDDHQHEIMMKDY